MKTHTLGQLKRRGVPPGYRSVKDELRSNLIRKLRDGEELFPGVVGYEETVIPGIINALLARHNFILLGLRGQAKSRILRALADLLDDEISVVAGSEINDDPFFPISSVSRRRIEEEGDNLPIASLRREDRYVEKLATPDVTVADIIGDLDPIKAARSGSHLSDLSNIHFGLLPRANRGIFAINELPDLAPKIQVALFNIMQEGDVQIKGFPVRLPLDVLLVFSANPEDYTARGKIITPLKDRIGAEIRTHYPERVEDGMRITRQEAWAEDRGELRVRVPDFVREVVEWIAFAGRRHPKIDQHSGVSQRLPITCMETVVSNAERRALRHGSDTATARVSDIYAAIPALSGKLELTYEGELKGGHVVAEELIRTAVHQAFGRFRDERNFDPIIQWFDLGGTVPATDQTSDADYYGRIQEIQELDGILEKAGVSPKRDLGLAVSYAEFLFEGLCAMKRLNRSEEKGYFREATEEESALYRQVQQGKVSLS
jgi:magnesium chelatase subunit I